ncbi:MAG: cell division protein FtsW [Cryptosporangiaceae bacterium]|jgi:cell division protein FtsW|nr:cell division protein FtsW [Cryptosporangiaceae bacterium]
MSPAGERGSRGHTTGSNPVLTASDVDRAAINPFAALSGLLQRPMASYFLLLASAGLLLAIGLVMVLSASSIDSIYANGSAFTEFGKQAGWALIGLPMFWLGLRLRVRAYELLGYPLLLLSAVLLALLAVAPGIGVAHNGTALWIQIAPGITMQPAEVAKLGLALWGAATLLHKRALLGQWKHMAIPLLPVSGLVLLLVGHNDLGSMLMLLVILLTLMWVSGVRFRAFGALLAVGMSGIIVLIFGTGLGYRQERLQTFADPFAYKDNAGYQVVHGLYSLASGGWWGLGLGHSREKWGHLPLAQNDFIFAVIGEELGVIGCFVVIALFGVMTYSGLRIARRVEDPFRRLVAASCTLWLASQALTNMGGVANLIPITGVPLPLISAGGSSLVLTMFIVGMLASFARAEPEAAVALHARRRVWWAKMWGIPLPPLPAPVAPARQRAGTANRRGSSPAGTTRRPAGARSGATRLAELD